MTTKCPSFYKIFDLVVLEFKKDKMSTNYRSVNNLKVSEKLLSFINKELLKELDISPENLYNNIEYISNLVGSEHVGLGLDYVYYQKQFLKQVKSNKFGLPKEYLENMGGFIYFEPEKIYDVVNILIKKNYKIKDIKGILGENFLRIASKNWK